MAFAVVEMTAGEEQFVIGKVVQELDQTVRGVDYVLLKNAAVEQGGVDVAVMNLIAQEHLIAVAMVNA